MCQRAPSDPQQRLLRHDFTLHKPQQSTRPRPLPLLLLLLPTVPLLALLPRPRIQTSILRPSALERDRAPAFRSSVLLFLRSERDDELANGATVGLDETAFDCECAGFEGFAGEGHRVIGVGGYDDGDGERFEGNARSTVIEIMM